MCKMHFNYILEFKHCIKQQSTIIWELLSNDWKCVNVYHIISPNVFYNIGFQLFNNPDQIMIILIAVWDVFQVQGFFLSFRWFLNHFHPLWLRHFQVLFKKTDCILINVKCLRFAGANQQANDHQTLQRKHFPAFFWHSWFLECLRGNDTRGTHTDDIITNPFLDSTSLDWTSLFICVVSKKKSKYLAARPFKI